MAQREPIDEPGSLPGGRHRKVPLEFPAPQQEKTINIWKVTLYFVILVIVLAALVYWGVHPRG
jgi:hypothetical protein